MLGDYLLSCSIDQHWAFSDLRTGHVLTRCLSDPNINQGNESHINGSLPLVLLSTTAARFFTHCFKLLWLCLLAIQSQYRQLCQFSDMPGYRLNLLVSYKSHHTPRTIQSKTCKRDTLAKFCHFLGKLFLEI